MKASGVTAAWQPLFSRIADGVQSEDDEQQLLLIQPCMHHLCLGCCRELVKLHTFKVALCPFCRRMINGFHHLL